VIEIRFVNGEDNTADILTKNLPRESFQKHQHNLLYGFGGNIDHLMNRSVSLHTILAHLETVNQIHELYAMSD